MPNTKSSDIRYKVLDRCLRRGGYSTSELMNEVNKELEFHGFSKATALNTIRQDMDYIASAYPEIIIEDKKVSRNITYQFKFRKLNFLKILFFSAGTALILCVLRAMRSSPFPLRACQNRVAKLPKEVKLCASASSA